MEAVAAIRVNETSPLVVLRLTCLDILQVVASKAGFFDVDLVDNDKDNVKVKASGNGFQLTVKADCLHKAVEKFVAAVGDRLPKETK